VVVKGVLDSAGKHPVYAVIVPLTDARLGEGRARLLLLLAPAQVDPADLAEIVFGSSKP
jgi:hypothetical protein